MIKSLDKRIYRDFKNNLGKYLSILILLCAIIAFGSSFLIVVDSTEKSLKQNQMEKNMEDGNFTLASPYQFDNSNIEENFYINLEADNTLRVYQNRVKINQLAVFDGKIADGTNEISLDRAFADSNQIKIGDMIQYQEHSFKVVGFVSVPDCTSLFKDNNDLMMNTKEFGLGFVTEETFRQLDNGYNVVYNYSFIGDKDEIKEYLTDNKIPIESFLPKELNQSISFIESDMGSDVPMMKVLIYIVIVIIAFVFVVLSSSNIEQDAKSIGTLKALGYRNNEIIMHYMKLPIFITIISALIGNILGYTVLIKPFKDILYITYSLPPLNIELNAEAFILTTIIPMLIMLFINYFALRSKINIKTIDFLRNNIRKTKTRTIKLSSKIKFKTRFKIRIIFDNLGSFIVLFAGIYLASLILIFGIGLIPIIKNYEEELMESAPANYQYILNAPVEADGYQLTQYKMKSHFQLADKDLDIMFIGLNDENPYFDGLKLQDLDDGIIISDSFANKFEIEIGDKVKFKDEILNEEYEYQVLDIYEYKTSFCVFLKQKDLNQLLDLPDEYFNSYFSDEKLDIDERYIKQEITREDLGNIASQMLSSFEDTLKLVNIFAVVIYLVLMYVLTKVIIERNALQISLLKIFGYNKHEIKKLYLNGTTIAVIALLLLVMPLETLSFKGLMVIVMMKVDGYLEVVIPLSIYLITFLTGTLSYLIINRMQVHKINKIPLEDALKERE